MARRRSDAEAGMSRRTFLKGGVAGSLVVAAGVGTYATLTSLTSPEQELSGAADEGFIYAPPLGAELPLWYEDLVGKEAQIEHFEIGQGAAVGWRAIRDRGGSITFPGFPAQLIRMDEATLEIPEGFPREEFLLDGLLGIFNTCTHAGCPPGWKVIPRDQFYVDPGFETIYCQCHWSQYDPRRIASYQHPPPPEASGAAYFGVFKLPAPTYGPADRGMPLIPLELDGNRIVGKVRNSEWYRYLTWKDIVIPEEA